MIEKLMVYAGAGGIGLAVAAIATVLLDVFIKILNKISHKVNIKKLRRQEEINRDPVKYFKKLKENTIKGKKNILMGIITLSLGTLCVLMFPIYRPITFSLGSSVGLLLYSCFLKYKEKGIQLLKLKDAINIYDSLNVYLPTGKNLPTALENIMPALEALSEPIENYIRRYPYNPHDALTQLEKEMDFDEAGLLVSVMMQVVATGRLEISSSEAVRLEDIRRSIYETSQSMRPLYSQLIQLLPAFSGISLILYIICKHAMLSIKNLGF